MLHREIVARVDFQLPETNRAIAVHTRCAPIADALSPDLAMYHEALNHMIICATLSFSSRFCGGIIRWLTPDLGTPQTQNRNRDL
jgi:hypothetical protein